MTARSIKVAALKWMQVEAELAHEAKPHIRPFPVAKFDGCSMAPNTVLACCYLHDLAYWHVETREERRRADANFRDCILEKTKLENIIWRWFWRATAWTYWVFVRLVGGRIVARRHRQWAKEEEPA